MSHTVHINASYFSKLVAGNTFHNSAPRFLEQFPSTCMSSPNTHHKMSHASVLIHVDTQDIGTCHKILKQNRSNVFLLTNV